MVSKLITFMNDLKKLPNIGPYLCELLMAIGVKDEITLRNMGSENAIIKISTLKNSGACINMLYAIEGAIQGIRWHKLNEKRKQELREFYKMLPK
jgi:DNA transformation protein and related proteins